MLTSSISLSVLKTGPQPLLSVNGYSIVWTVGCTENCSVAMETITEWCAVLQFSEKTQEPQTAHFGGEDCLQGTEETVSHLCRAEEEGKH